MLQRDYFATVLANRSGHIDDSILLLNRALPNIRESQAKRAAIALEALADDYNKSFRYGDAARKYHDLLAHFAGQLDRGRLSPMLEESRLVREDTFVKRVNADLEREWLRKNRSEEAKHWNLLTNWRLEHLQYVL